MPAPDYSDQTFKTAWKTIKVAGLPEQFFWMLRAGGLLRNDAEVAAYDEWEANGGNDAGA